MFRLFKAESWRTRVLPSAGQGMVTLLLATLAKRASPGSAKDGASVNTGGEKELNTKICTWTVDGNLSIDM